ncbi:MAG: domain containing protein, partial [Candidatus Solibacter sp.]|nr:domain containing protein [Candidatus Solibacter sp.]
HLPPPRNAAAAPKPAAAAPTAPLDEAYFHANIDPILQKKGADGYACVSCHATHTLFNATWSTVKNVIDRADPENSLLLRKPTSTAESEGVAGATSTAHGGGQRWQRSSPEYETILKWMQGAAAAAPAK